ncbi:MAG TPA: alkaline phosphatase family protein [Gaiellaceae bacterium]|nr:alkaline phosphatase family protein [Gaiellaceae bacterium]
MATAKKLVQIVVDGMTPSALEHAVASGDSPALSFLAEHGAYGQAVSVFPSLTPVCLSSIATGAGPDVHEIPSLVWWHRGEQRIVEYGSSFAALRAAGMTQAITDTILNMNERHLGSRAVTVFEALEDAGLTAAAVNITCYRGRHRYAPKVPLVRRPAHGPSRFFYYSLFESDRTGARLAVRNRTGGSVDAYAAEVGRWLVTRDGFDYCAYYLSDYDYASHALGPARAAEVALGRTDAAIQALFDAAGGPDEFLERYAVVLHSDHGQTEVREAARLEDSFAGLGEVVVAPSNRAGQVYLLPGARTDAAALARRLDRVAAVEVTLRLEEGEAVARRDGEELRFRPDAAAGWTTSGDASILDQPDALHRAWSALANPNAGELLVSASEGWELADLGGSHHAGGGSHGSLVAGDSLVPVLTAGIDARIERITDAMPAVLAHFGVAPPPYARRLQHVG